MKMAAPPVLLTKIPHLCCRTRLALSFSHSLYSMLKDKMKAATPPALLTGMPHLRCRTRLALTFSLSLYSMLKDKMKAAAPPALLTGMPHLRSPAATNTYYVDNKAKNMSVRTYGRRANQTARVSERHAAGLRSHPCPSPGQCRDPLQKPSDHLCKQTRRQSIYTGGQSPGVSWANPGDALRPSHRRPDNMALLVFAVAALVWARLSKGNLPGCVRLV